MNKEERKKIIFVVGKRYYINYNENETDILREVNLYADFVRDPESYDTDVELKIVPAKMYNMTVVHGSDCNIILMWWGPIPACFEHSLNQLLS